MRKLILTVWCAPSGESECAFAQAMQSLSSPTRQFIVKQIVSIRALNGGVCCTPISRLQTLDFVQRSGSIRTFVFFSQAKQLQD